MADCGGSPASSLSPSPCEEEKAATKAISINGPGESQLEDQVMSEIHIGCPPHHSGPHISHFAFTIPSGVEHERNAYFEEECSSKEHMGDMDEDGDLIIARKSRIEHERSTYFEEDCISKEHMGDMDEDGDLIIARKSKILGATGGVTIQHKIMSTIAGVGCQIWRAELILADFILHMMFTSAELNEVTAVELGAGTGLVGILLARVAKTVYITDRGGDILDNCAKNVELNSGAFRSHSSVHVRELDWQSVWPPSFDINNEYRVDYSWALSEVDDVNRASLLLAADVIYSDDLTDAFFSMLEKLMSQGSEKVLYLALEKRYNFSLTDLDIVANGYSHFRSYLGDEVDDGAEPVGIEDDPLPKFVGKCIDLSSVPQYMRGYNRCDDVELWSITYDNRTAWN